MSYRSVSYWFDSLGAEPEPRPPLPGDLEVDVAIVGGGFTGLWTAYYLAIADPSCRVAVIERDTVGFGAAGRNGGWCMGVVQGLRHYFERDPQGGAALRDAIFAAVDEVGAVCKSEAIDADFHKGGGLTVATDEAQAERLRESLQAQRELGVTEADARWLEPDELVAHMRVARSCGGAFMAHCAAVNPAKLARGVADAAERRGAAIYEQTQALAVEPGRVRTSRGLVRARRVVVALEAYAAQLAGYERSILPVYNHMIATEPLPARVWDEIGLVEHGLFGDASRYLVYAQRTADDRIAIGGRSVGYHYGSAIAPRFDRDERVEQKVVDALHEMLPQVRDFTITHRWGGIFGFPRDLVSSVSLDTATGIAVGGSYGGDGVCASNLTGRTLCDLILERETPLVKLPWVGHRAPRWEPEPLRWLGVSAALGLNASADAAERRSGRRPRIRERLLRALGFDLAY
jgi:glycine/D-amino acid oxidase-like deaminating enzyme